MFIPFGNTPRKTCDGITRRHALRIGASGLIGGLSLPSLLELQAKASTARPAAAQACIFIFLEGGPSHIDMWDLKPDAPAEVRGPFRPIRTNVTGTMIGEHLPLCARMADKYTIVRSHSHSDNGHNTGYHYVMTGYRADFPDGNTRMPNNHLYPSIGSIVSRELGPRTTLPPYINMPHIMAGGGPGFYGSEHAPFVIEANPSQADFEVQDLRPLEGMSVSRQARRRRLLTEVEELERHRADQGRARTMSTYYQRARDLMTSAEARRAFDIRSESEAVRQAYGYSSLGQCALLARRLVEAGCRFVGIDHSGWDHHSTIFPSLEKDMLPHVDKAFSALLADLQLRGLLQSTLVVMMGEMGRTPVVNPAAGRDHWSMAQSVLFAGGGVRPGQVIGATDRRAAAPTADPVSVEDILRTVFQQMGVDTTKTYHTPLGRPVPIVDGGRIIPGLVERVPGRAELRKQPGNAPGATRHHPTAYAARLAKIEGNGSMRIAPPLLALICTLAVARTARAQKLPEAGYIFPPGGKAGTTVDVHLGGYDWTPDMEFFVHDRRVQLIPSGPPGPILIPPPPYWFGAKGRLASPPLPREVPAKLVIAADAPPGPIYWQAANANGCTSTGVFIVGAGADVVEDENRKVPQLLPSLPITVSGRLAKNEEVDRYRFVVPKDGPMTCELTSRRLGAKFLAILQVRDSTGQLVTDVAGTNGIDPSLTFAAKAGAEYVVSIHDIDFAGDRSFVYRLAVTPGPRVVGAIPAAGKHGETREVEFVGIGVATGAAKLESVKRSVTFPTIGTAWDYQLDTAWGTAPPFRLLLSDLPEIVSRAAATRFTGPAREAGPTVSTAITGVLERPDQEDNYFCNWTKKGQVWSLSLEARRLGSPLDVALAVFGPDRKERARNDDLPETTDAGLEFTVPVGGSYRIVVSDLAGKTGSRAAIYRLVVREAESDFALTLASPRVSVPLGGKFDLAVKAIRKGGFKGPIALTIKGLPAGISAPPNLVIAADKTDLLIPMQAAADAATSASLVIVEGAATVGATTITRTALAKTTVNLAPRSPEENQVASILVAATLKPRFKGRPVDQDTGRKVHRGTTFPAEVLVERLDGFQGEITLQMAAQQSYQVQGITGGDVLVPPGVSKTIYPCFMPEWLETTRTSRMGMIAVAKVADPKGKVRYLANDITGFITMTMEGALLKLSHDGGDLSVPAGLPFDVHVKLARLSKLIEPVRLELRLPDELAGQLRAEPMVVAVGKESAILRITPAASLIGLHTFTIRGTALEGERYPVISETPVTVEFLPAAAAPR